MALPNHWIHLLIRYADSDHCEHSDGANGVLVVADEVDEDPSLKRWPKGFDDQQRLEWMMVMMVDDQMVKCNLM